MLPWFGGLCLLSYLGCYPAAASGAGNLDVVPYPWAVLAVFSALVMWLAVSCRLPDDQARAEIAGPDTDHPLSTSDADRAV